MLNKLKTSYAEFPPLFWIIVITLFIDSIGSTLLFPFFALYITQKFAVGMTEAGVLLGMSSLFGLVGSMVGGAITDRSRLASGGPGRPVLLRRADRRF